jgi:hypothetical protein
MRQNNPVAVDRLAQLNDPTDAFKSPAQLNFVRTLVDILRRMSQDFVARDTASPYVILLSPNGTAYKVTVADDGTLQAVNARA